MESHESTQISLLIAAIICCVQYICVLLAFLSVSIISAAGIQYNCLFLSLLSFRQEICTMCCWDPVLVNGSLLCCYCSSVWRDVVSHWCSRVRPCPISLRHSRNTLCQNIQTQPKQLDFWARVRRFALTTSTALTAQHSPTQVQELEAVSWGARREQHWRRNVRRWAVSFHPKYEGQKIEQKIWKSE